jgi:hypothetical protein
MKEETRKNVMFSCYYWKAKKRSAKIVTSRILNTEKFKFSLINSGTSARGLLDLLGVNPRTHVSS